MGLGSDVRAGAATEERMNGGWPRRGADNAVGYRNRAKKNM